MEVSMDLLILFIIIAVVLATSGKKQEKGKNKQGAAEANRAVNTAKNWANRAMSNANAYRETSANSYAQRRSSSESSNASRPVTVSKAQQAKTSSTVAAMAKKAAENRNTTIVERAKSNTNKLREDETLKEIEQMHGHEEHHEEAAVAHSRNCQTLGEKGTEEVSESLLGSTEDLIVKGYSGNLQFDRDFLGEASDMLSAISYPNFQTPGV